MILNYEGRELDVEYTYLPREERTEDYPGEEEGVDVFSLVYEGENVIDLYDEDEMQVIACLVLDSHNDDDFERKLESLL